MNLVNNIHFKLPYRRRIFDRFSQFPYFTQTIGHAYLFTGTRGTGKTSVAKIFARAVNCANAINGGACGKCEICKELAKPNNLDIIEIDAASNNGVQKYT